MASKDFSDWRTLVGYYLKFTSSYNDYVDNAVKETVRDFCRDVPVWLITLTRISTVADTSTYTLTVPNTDGDAEIVNAYNVKYKENGADDTQFRNLDPFTKAERDDRENGSWEFHTGSEPYRFYLNQTKQLILYPIPENASASGLLVTVQVRPTDDATACIDIIYLNYKDAIAKGAAAYLYNQPNLPWSNQDMARSYEVQYHARRDEAYVDIKNGFTRSLSTIDIPWVGGSRSESWNWKP